MIRGTGQVTYCNLPIRIDTYIGCSHDCKYCFTRRKTNLNKIKPSNCIKSLRKFIKGERILVTKWCDWDIPLHWGGMSDPFQPIEKKHKISLKCLEIFAETQYPFVVSTKGKLIIEPEYLNLLSQCNCVVQISMLCSDYDKIEPGAPSFEERLKMLEILSPKVKRTIVRMQPYIIEMKDNILPNIKRLSDAGAHGVILEGMKIMGGKFDKNKFIKIGNDICYKTRYLMRDFERIRLEVHRNNMKFYSGENRLRAMGDDMTCCGIDGLEGFVPNNYNICMLYNGQNPVPTENMKSAGSGKAFERMFQTTVNHRIISKNSFADMMLFLSKQKREYMELVLNYKKTY